MRVRPLICSFAHKRPCKLLCPPVCVFVCARSLLWAFLFIPSACEWIVTHTHSIGLIAHQSVFCLSCSVCLAACNWLVFASLILSLSLLVSRCQDIFVYFSSLTFEAFCVQVQANADQIHQTHTHTHRHTHTHTKFITTQTQEQLLDLINEPTNYNYNRKYYHQLFRHSTKLSLIN